MKFCSKAGANLFSLMCKLLQGKTISSDHQNNIVIKSTDVNIILDHRIKTHDGWVARVKFLWETSDERAQSATAPCKKNINNLHVEFGFPSESITHATAKASSLQVMGTFMPYEDYALSKAKQQAASKKAVAQSIGREAFLWHKLSINSHFWQ